MDQRSGDDSLEELKSSRSGSGEDFPKFEMLDAKIASALTRSSRIPSSNRFCEEDRSLS